MSKEKVAKFYELASQDTKLQSHLDEINKKFEDKKIEESLKRFIVEVEIIPLAKGVGFELDCEDIISFIDEKFKKISKENVEQISGGHNLDRKSNSHFSLGEMAAAKVAKKSIINSATEKANKFYQQNYKIDE